MRHLLTTLIEAKNKGCANTGGNKNEQKIAKEAKNEKTVLNRR